MSSSTDGLVETILAPNPSVLTGPGTNSYVLGRGGDVLVIDPGPADSGHLERLEQAARRRGRVSAILLSHHHSDHSESAVAFAKRFDAELLAKPHADGPAPDRAIGEGARVEFGGGAVEAWETPGHTRDHLCFAAGDAGLVFGGDLVATQGYIIVDPPDGDMAQYLASLRRVRDHFASTGEPPGRLLPGHGAAIEAPVDHLDNYIGHRLEREARVLDSLTGDSPLNALEILAVAYADTPVELFPLAARSLAAHLDKLVSEGRATRFGEREEARYSAGP